MSKLLSNDILVRALKTAVQAFLATVAVGATSVTDVATAKALVVAGVAAAISAVWNSILAAK
jgi:hypothetical protein